MKKQGKLIVIEGSDGAGKATQLNLLKNSIENKKIPVETIDFPRYYDSFYGKMAAQFLRGEFGKLQEVHPYLASLVFALDRAQAREEMEKWLHDGKIVLSNRYAPSNLAHQSAKLSTGKRSAFITWDLALEYEINKIPREDIVIYLYVPYKISRKLVLQKSNDARIYAKGKKRDIQERDINFLKNSEQAYLRLVKKFPHWVKINCVDMKGNLKSREEIHEMIKEVLAKKHILDVK